jgi:hypothetical protein
MTSAFFFINVSCFLLTTPHCSLRSLFFGITLIWFDRLEWRQHGHGLGDFDCVHGVLTVKAAKE